MVQEQSFHHSGYPDARNHFSSSAVTLSRFCESGIAMIRNFNVHYRRFHHLLNSGSLDWIGGKKVGVSRLVRSGLDTQINSVSGIEEIQCIKTGPLQTCVPASFGLLVCEECGRATLPCASWRHRSGCEKCRLSSGLILQGCIPAGDTSFAHCKLSSRTL